MTATLGNQLIKKWMKTMLTSDAVYETTTRIENYRRLTQLIKLKSVEIDRCTLSHKVMANFLDVTTAEINRWIQVLIAFDIIEQMDQGSSYRAKNPAIERTILDHISELLRLMRDQPNLSFREQAESMDISMQELESLYGLLIPIMG